MWTEPLPILVMLGALVYVLSIIGFCCYKICKWRKKMRVGDIDLEVDADLHLRHTASMMPYDPEVLDIEGMA